MAINKMKCCLHKVCRVVWEKESHQAKKVRQSRGLEIDLRGSEVVPAVVLQWWRPEGPARQRPRKRGDNWRSPVFSPCCRFILVLRRVPGQKGTLFRAAEKKALNKNEN